MSVEGVGGLAFVCVDVTCEMEAMRWCSGYGHYVLEVVSKTGRIAVTLTCRGHQVASCEAIQGTCIDEGDGFTGAAVVSINRDSWSEGSYSIEDPVNPGPICYDVANPEAQVPCDALDPYGS